MNRLGLLLGALLLVLASPVWAAGEIGTCLTSAGVVIGPFSDALDPACGGDACAVSDTTANETLALCSSVEGRCAEFDIAVLHMPAPAPASPRGPICVENTGNCGSGAPGGTADWVSTVQLESGHDLRPAAKQGLLPGAGPSTYRPRGAQRVGQPPCRPPR